MKNKEYFFTLMEDMVFCYLSNNPDSEYRNEIHEILNALDSMRLEEETLHQ